MLYLAHGLVEFVGGPRDDRVAVVAQHELVDVLEHLSCIIVRRPKPFVIDANKLDISNLPKFTRDSCGSKIFEAMRSGSSCKRRRER